MNQEPDQDLREFVARARHALGDQVSGHTEPYAELWSHADDVVVMGAIGSYSRGSASVREHLAEAAKTLSWSDLDMQSISFLCGGDLGVTIDLEHMSKQVAENKIQRTLRSTQIYRRENGAWWIVHRHAEGIQEDAPSQ